MPTATGTSISLKNFSDSFLAFAVANAGFTDAGTVTVNVSGGTADAHSVTKGGVTYVFVTAQNSEFILSGPNIQRMEARMCYATPVASTTWSASNPVGQPGLTQCGIFAAGLTFSSPHWFFTNGSACHAVLEIFPNVFTHLSFGILNKMGVYTGGEFLTSTYYFVKGGNPSVFTHSTSNQIPWSESNISTNSGYIRYSLGSSDENDFAPMGTATNSISGGFFQDSKGVVHNNDATTGPGDGWGFVSTLFVNSPNAFNLRSPLIPIYMLLRDTTTTATQYHPIGYPDGVRLVNIKEFDPKVLVDNDWQVFPLAQKLGDNSVATITGNLALAYDTSV